MAIAHLNDTELFYVEVGEGPPCLMMHGGLGMDHTYLHPWLDPLGEDMRLIYYDHRGNGRSGRPPVETLTFDRFCADADALRGRLGFEKVAVLGHSYGGWIALEYALRYPDHLSHLILYDTSPSFDYGAEVAANMLRKGATEEQLATFGGPIPNDAAFRRWMEVVGPIYWHVFDADLADLVFSRTVYNAETLRWSLNLIREWNVTRRLGEIRVPTLILVGDDDFITPVSQAKILRGGIPGSELVVFEKSGHLSHLETPDAFFGAVRKWLGQETNFSGNRSSGLGEFNEPLAAGSSNR